MDSLVFKNLILVDDDPDEQEIFLLALRDVAKRLKPVFVNNGEELLAMLDNPSTAAPDIIFLDINMPKKDGIETLRELRNNPATASIPVIMYSTSSDERHAERAHYFGANLYFVKPNSLARLKDMLQQALSIDWNSFRVPERLSEFMIA